MGRALCNASFFFFHIISIRDCTTIVAALGFDDATVGHWGRCDSTRPNMSRVESVPSVDEKTTANNIS